MTYIAVIVESPAKCSKIESFLGPGYKCMASFGHIRTIDHINCIAVDDNFTPTFKVIDGKTRQIKALNSFIGKATEVMLATDDDREGEAIAWHICEHFKLDVATTKRIVFHEITQQAIKTAVENHTIINMNIVEAQQARQILDLLVGFKISPVLWGNISYKTAIPLSAGRCQTPALRIIYENQKENSFWFQVLAYITRLRNFMSIVEANPDKIIVCERSIYTDKYVFARMLYEAGNINEIEWKTYCYWFDTFKEKTKVDVILYVNTKPDECFNRINKRSRPEEVNKISKDYLTICHNKHLQWFNESEDKSNIIYINGHESVENVMNNVNQIINNLIYEKLKIEIKNRN